MKPMNAPKYETLLTDPSPRAPQKHLASPPRLPPSMRRRPLKEVPMTPMSADPRRRGAIPSPPLPESRVSLSSPAGVHARATQRPASPGRGSLLSTTRGRHDSDAEALESPHLEHDALQATDDAFDDDRADAATLNLEGQALEQARHIDDTHPAERRRAWDQTYIKRLRLQVVSGPDLGLTLVLREGGRCVLGRALSSNLSFRDPSVSRRHVALILSEGRLAFKDLASGNGVRVNRARLKEGIWYPGDSVYLGTNRLVIEPLESVPRHTMTAGLRRAERGLRVDGAHGAQASGVNALLQHKVMLGYRALDWLVAGAAFGVTAALTLWLASALFGATL